MPSDTESIVKNSYASAPKYTEIQAGVPESYKDIRTLRDLLAINYKLLSSREQIRQNLIIQRQQEQSCYPGIIGFDDDVIPALDRALLSGHDVLFIGQMGQAKTRLVQTVAENLLSMIPVIRGSITNDCPIDLPQDQLIAAINDCEPKTTNPVFYASPDSIDVLRNEGLDTPVTWIEGRHRYKYVLATPDISVKDLVGYIDAIKVAKKGIETYKIDSYSPGQLMQARHGIFCIDELPVLDPRKQVSLLSVLQEGRFTTGSYPVIFEPKTMLFATANPVDYTHSGKIIEPLSDRLKSHIHTHYPKSIHDEMMIILQEAKLPTGSFVPESILRLLATLVQKMRESEQINQERGVSARLGIHGLEILAGEAERTRALVHGIGPLPRLSDVHSISQVAKFELTELDDTIDNRAKVFGDLLDESIREITLGLLESVPETVLQSVKAEFGSDIFRVSQYTVWTDSSESYAAQVEKFPGLRRLINSGLEAARDAQDTLIEQSAIHGIDPGTVMQSNTELRALLTELILEGLRWTTPKVLDRRDSGYASA